MGRKLRNIAAGTIAVSALAMSACADDGRSRESDPTPSTAVGSGTQLTGAAPREQLTLADAPAADAVVARSSLLGLQVADAVGSDNVVISPASLTTTLAMLAPAASDAAADELASLLGAMHMEAVDSVNALSGGLSAYAGDPAAFDPGIPPDQPFLHLAQQLLVDDRANPTQEYLDVLSASFETPVDSVDLSSSSAKAMLDEWVSDNTGGLSPSSALQPDDQSVFAMQQSILFGARWDHTFPEYKTMDRDFTLNGGSRISVEMMSDTFDTRHAATDGWEAVALEYNEGFQAIVVLPPKGTDPLDSGAAETDAIVTLLAQELARAEDQRVAVTMPLLELTSTVDVLPALQELGVSSLVSCADRPLPGLGETVCVTQAVQQTVLRVSEKGTVAAAVTEVLGAGAAPDDGSTVIPFTVDRPFLMIIESAETGWDLFQVVVRDPR